MELTPDQPRAGQAPLNTFQRLLRQWDQIHPYNAGQVLKIQGRGDTAAITAAWHDTLATLGLGRTSLDGSMVRHVALNGQAERHPIAVVDPNRPICDHLSQELNRPFNDPAEPPFRPFVQCRGDHHYMGVSYHHWVADSVSIRMLLREWFFRIHAPERARNRPLKQNSEGYWSIFGPAKANWSWGSGLLSSARWSARNRRVARIEIPGYDDFNARFELRPLGDDLITPLLKYARANGVTLNDLFLAVSAQVCNQFVPFKRTSRRTDLALGTIVDLRPYSTRDLSDTFGLFLGFTSTILRPDDLADFLRLLKAVSTQSNLQKKTRVPLTSPVRMLAGLAFGKWFGMKKMVEFYRKRLPLAGGISNVNMNQSWAGEFHPSPLLDYIRVSPTGPMMPLVFTPTTLGKQLHLGFTYRPAIIPIARAAEMVGRFEERLKELADGK